MKPILLDTHCWLWMLASPERFSGEVLEVLERPDTELLLSAASSWEIAIKTRLGKLQLPEPAASYVPSRMESTGVRGLDVSHAHALGVAQLPLHHRDPFDRLLVSQARVEGLTLLTLDRQLLAYEVDVRIAE